MPGAARMVHSTKNPGHPSCATIHPAAELMNVRGTAARLVNSANWVAVYAGCGRGQ